eukprot:EG_transcript_22067
MKMQNSAHMHGTPPKCPQDLSMRRSYPFLGRLPWLPQTATKTALPAPGRLALNRKAAPLSTSVCRWRDLSPPPPHHSLSACDVVPLPLPFRPSLRFVPGLGQ